MKVSPWRAWIGSLLVLFLAASAAYSANIADLREDYPPPAARVQAPAAGRTAAQQPDGAGETSLRSHPWWQQIDTFEGTGSSTTEAFTVVEHALQWRVVWSCKQGSLQVQPQDASGNAVGHAVVEAECPGTGTGFAVSSGEFALEVQSAGEWTVTVEQQLDVPVIEPPTAAMKAGKIVASGTFYDIDRTGHGRVDVYRLKNGSHALRLEDFYVTPNVDLEIDVSRARRPADTAQFADAPFERVAMLPVTTGSMNFEVPDRIDPLQWPSIVIYCAPLHIAYIGATLSEG